MLLDQPVQALAQPVRRGITVTQAVAFIFGLAILGMFVVAAADVSATQVAEWLNEGVSND